MQYRILGKTGFEVSCIGYGGIVSSQSFDGAHIDGDGQEMSDSYVDWAISKGINYFDVAPSYGDAQEKMGNSIKSYRDKIYLACKTNVRTASEARKELDESLRLLHTDRFDVYQLHGLCTMEELDTCFGPGGVMEMIEDMKKNGVTDKVGFTAHSEEVALAALDRYDFDTVMFPLNWHMNMAHDFGSRISKAVKDKGLGLLCIKSMIECAWAEGERYGSKYPKSWCKPLDAETQQDLLLAALRYSLSLGADILIPPGNFDHFKFAVDHADEILANPFSAADEALLREHLSVVKDKPFFDL